MFSLAYVRLPMSDRSPAEAIRKSLARFQRGSTGDVCEDWLRFRDETAYVEELRRASFTFTLEGAGLRIEGGESWYPNSVAFREEMEQRCIDRWPICFADM